MIYPSGDTIEQKVGSRYSLVVIAAKRAKQIKEGAPVLIDTESTNPLTIAMEEIAAGKVTVQEASLTPADAPKHTTEDSPADAAGLIEAKSAKMTVSDTSDEVTA